MNDNYLVILYLIDNLICGVRLNRNILCYMLPYKEGKWQTGNPIRDCSITRTIPQLLFMRINTPYQPIILITADTFILLPFRAIFQKG